VYYTVWLQFKNCKGLKNYNIYVKCTHITWNLLTSFAVKKVKAT